MWLDDTDSLQKISKKSRQPSKKKNKSLFMENMKKNGYMYSCGNKVWFTSSILNSVDLFNNLLVLFFGQLLTYTNDCVNIFFYMKREWKGASSNPGYENNSVNRLMQKHKICKTSCWT